MTCAYEYNCIIQLHTICITKLFCFSFLGTITQLQALKMFANNTEASLDFSLQPPPIAS